MRVQPFEIKLADMGCGSFHKFKDEVNTIKGTITFMAPELV